MTNQKLTLVSILLLSLFLMATLATFRQQAQDKSQSQQKETDKSDENFPLVSLDTSNQAQRLDETRKMRNEKFDNSRWVKQTVYEGVASVGRMSHWQLGLPALPVQKSDVVAVGVVKSAEAFLSNNQTGVYSEFSVLVDSLVKDNQSKPIESGANIVVQRAGGRVRYPTGQIVKYSVSGQEMPRLNGKYVFFLGYDKQREVYRIITAYEVSYGKVTALDGKRKDRKSGFVFSQYDGVEERQFMNELHDTPSYGNTTIRLFP
jgi:hypothetical protein